MNANGYDRDIAAVRATPAPVRPIAVPVKRWADVRLNPALGVLTVPAGAALDLGATAKAFTADLAARTLFARYGSPVLVELGGDLAVAGSLPGGWPVRVRRGRGRARADRHDQPRRRRDLDDDGAALAAR